MLNQSTAMRLMTQLETLPFVLGGATPEALQKRPTAGQWSAHENLAHLARHHEVFLERLQRILAEENPRLSRYRAEEDPDWPPWSALPTEAVLRRLQALRQTLIERVQGLSSDQLDRVGIHATFGALTLLQWLEFFLLHEAHHLYVIMSRARGA